MFSTVGPLSAVGSLKVKPLANVKKEETSNDDQLSLDVKNLDLMDEVSNNARNNGKLAQTFTFEELAAATGNFRSDCCLVKEVSAKFTRGFAIKQLDRNGLQGTREFVIEVLTLSLADHPNLVKLIGYCAEGDQRLLVYEYMSLGSLENHLHDLPHNRQPLDWNTRMKIAAGAAKGLEYLHDKMKPPEQPNMRPAVSDVVMALNYLASQKYDPQIDPVEGSHQTSSRPGLKKDNDRSVGNISP
ncbi:hypothetical protein GH714_013733 [Hevea brasiliensis]|uniref:Protein kinase domain-containing protein n=1 Tax=Hevea brasiliensis TaxID=3981 RepID=A0A6A6LJ04_HEVBR|nr:hypothetical protein GH714_013733 [Hevea brasiliensis]